MTRDEVLARYRLVRAAIQRVLKAAPSVCTRADWMRAAKQLGLESNEHQILVEDDQIIDMLADVALFVPNQRGNRAYDRFLSRAARALSPEDQSIAQAMSKAYFSLFQISGRHPAAGLWLDDLLADKRRIWMMDESLEASASDGLLFAARLFDAGDFHAGFGIILPLDEASAHEYRALSTNPAFSPEGRRFVPLVYHDAIYCTASEDIDEMILALNDLVDALAQSKVTRKQKRKPT